MAEVLLLVAVSAVFGTALADGGDQLRLVQAVWRHGDRSPTGTFKNDPITVKDWPQGFGQLTPEGMKQHLYLGQNLAARYVTDLKFIDGSYRANEVYVRSTDVNRTLISAMSNFIGFYGNTAKAGTDYPDDSLWPKNYVPIPVHTVDDDTDYLGNPDRYCPRLDAVTDLWPQTPEFKANNEKYKDLLANLTRICGQKIDLYNIWLVFDALFIEKTYGFEGRMIKELLDLYPQIKEVDDLNDDWTDGINLSPVKGINFALEVPRIRGGPLLWAIIDHMRGKANCLKHPDNKHRYCKWMDPLKYYVYSAHDTTVSALFSAFGFQHANWNETGFPHYSSCVTVELWQKPAPDNSFYVKVVYFPLEKDEKKRPHEDLTTQVSGCKTGCTLDEFVTRSKPYKMEPSPQEYCAKVDDITGGGNGQTSSSTAPVSVTSSGATVAGSTQAPDATTKSASTVAVRMLLLVTGLILASFAA